MAERKRDEAAEEMTVDTANLHREDHFTDLKVATIRRLTPVKVDGSPDPARPTLFVAQTHVMTNRGPVPIDCEIEARDLREATEKFPAAVQAAVERLVQQVEQLQREAASRIVTPRDQILSPGAALGGAMPPPPGRGGGDILLR
jgi:hypothetical protein